MKDVFFGYKQTTNCKHCGTPRVLADWDDDVYVFPGRVIVKKATCDFEARAIPFGQTYKECPKCGGEIIEETENAELGLAWAGTTKYVCVNARERTEVQRLKGCDKCYSSGHHFW